MTNQQLGRRIGGLTCQARHGGEVAARARQGFRARFEREADPDGTLPAEERARRADLLFRAHMLRLAAKSAESRRRR